MPAFSVFRDQISKQVTASMSARQSGAPDGNDVHASAFFLSRIERGESRDKDTRNCYEDSKAL